jgi:hypothetical protein
MGSESDNLHVISRSNYGAKFYNKKGLFLIKETG